MVIVNDIAGSYLYFNFKANYEHFKMYKQFTIIKCFNLII